MSVEVSEARAAVVDGDHCREMAGRVRELARYTRSPGIRRELVISRSATTGAGDHFDLRQRRKI